MTVPSQTQPPFRMFDVQVTRVRRLSPSFVRLTFTGADLDAMADNGFDQRVKLILPVAEHGLEPLPRGEDWYSAWRLLPERMRNPIRTYTVRHLRPGDREVDIDMVLHGDEHGTVSGPAARFAFEARPGDEAVLLGPNAAHTGPQGGLEFRPDSSYASLLLAADETGVPAVANIVRALPPHAVGRVLLEVPHPDDRFDLGGPPGLEVTWAARGGSGHGSHLLRMVSTADLPRPIVAAALPAAGEHDDLGDVLWEVPDAVERPLDDTGDPTDGFYAWVAGEASTVRAIRRHLVNERGHDRRSIAFMGYWRLGRAEC